ncbi:3-oxoacyl-[acyl-carrier-protein] synthase 3 [Brevifollis gellanilyticus]|uniref:3-oxoacyl-[acyl-carrier-protein] synthase 3 n=2 Tax=Brevifollis gellanilyticus TaxID=748831 RepID=A0A512MCJ1_9BACT|nr:3-oxoacyl-[acyl-carrier-protein] synthase 3 [Brevifollis gellanilyticus]
MAQGAVRNALDQAGISIGELGAETVLLHIQNGITHLTPPASIVLAGSLGLKRVRCLSIDGVCAEPINALEIAALMFNAGLCSRAIISASVDFTALIDPADNQTSGLFGCGAGALIAEPAKANSPYGLHGLTWETHSEHWKLGVSPMLSSRAEKNGVSVTFGHYQMKGQELARVALRVLNGVLGRTLDEATCSINDCDLVVSHQPNVKMLDIGLPRLGIPLDKVPRPGAWMGNLGPASLLVGLSTAKESGLIADGKKVLLLSFGLGFSAGAAVIQF